MNITVADTLNHRATWQPIKVGIYVFNMYITYISYKLSSALQLCVKTFQHSQQCLCVWLILADVCCVVPQCGLGILHSSGKTRQYEQEKQEDHQTMKDLSFLF